MQLKEKLRLNDKISKFFPELPKWSNKVSIKDLLQYTSGIPDINLGKKLIEMNHTFTVLGYVDLQVMMLS